MPILVDSDMNHQHVKKIIIFLFWSVWFSLVSGRASTSSSTSSKRLTARDGCRGSSCRGGRKGGIPHSYNGYRFEEDDESRSMGGGSSLLWNPSRKIDDEGFLSERYQCAIGTWESEMEIRGKYGSRSRHCERFARHPVIVRQVPGDGNCLFHSLAAALKMAETGKHMNFTSSSLSYVDRSTSMQLRQRAIDMLSKRPLRKLFLQGNDFLRACDLVQTAASQYSITGDEYCRLMRKDGYWGGGPEIVALSNALRRPIHVYELASSTKPIEQEMQKFWKKFKTTFQLRRMACFGSPKFDSREPLHILSADSRFPDLIPGRQLSSGNHFLALFFPTAKMLRQERFKTKRNFAALRSGSTTTTTTYPAATVNSSSYQQTVSEVLESHSGNNNIAYFFQKWLVLYATHFQKVSSSCQETLTCCAGKILYTSLNFIKALVD